MNLGKNFDINRLINKAWREKWSIHAKLSKLLRVCAFNLQQKNHPKSISFRSKRRRNIKIFLKWVLINPNVWIVFYLFLFYYNTIKLYLLTKIIYHRSFLGIFFFVNCIHTTLTSVSSQLIMSYTQNSAIGPCAYSVFLSKQTVQRLQCILLIAYFANSTCSS